MREDTRMALFRPHPPIFCNCGLLKHFPTIISIITLVVMALPVLMTRRMQLVYKVATLLRVAVRGFLALAALWLAGNGGWILVMNQGASAIHLAELCGVLAVLASAAWHWMGNMERQHESILVKHRTFAKKSAPLRKKTPTSAPIAARPSASKALVPQAG